MPSGITGATITNLVAGTTIVAADVLASLNSLKSNGVNCDGGLVTTDNSGGITAVKFSTANGQIRGTFFLATPYHMFGNPTLNSGTTRTDTYTGGSTGVPSGAKAVLLGIGIFANTANGYLQIYPAGGTAGQGPGITGVGTSYTVSSCVCPVDGSGQITLKAVSSNIVLQDWYIYGYII
jgi:hypothetical protein